MIVPLWIIGLGCIVPDRGHDLDYELSITDHIAYQKAYDNEDQLL